MCQTAALNFYNLFLSQPQEALSYHFPPLKAVIRCKSNGSLFDKPTTEHLTFLADRTFLHFSYSLWLSCSLPVFTFFLKNHNGALQPTDDSAALCCKSMFTEEINFSESPMQWHFFQLTKSHHLSFVGLKTKTILSHKVSFPKFVSSARSNLEKMMRKRRTCKPTGEILQSSQS